MSKTTKIIIALVAGFALAMIAMTMAIYFGYTEAYNSNAEALTVTVLGLPIYELTKAGTDYFGTNIGTNMGIFCGICMILADLVEEIFSRVK